MRHVQAIAGLLCAALGVPCAGAQGVERAAPGAEARHAITLVGGVSQFDLSGTGTTALVGVRVETALQRWLVAEGAVSGFRPMLQFGGRRSYGIPEVQLQVQVPGRVLRPYLGVGLGTVFTSAPDVPRETVSGAAGVRARLSTLPVDVRGELRVRGIGTSFEGSTAEWTVGLGRHF